MDIGGVVNLDPAAIHDLLRILEALDDDEFVDLDDESEESWERQRDPDRPFTLAQAKEKFRDWKSETRFRPEQFDFLVETLNLPDFFPTQEQRDVSST